MPSSTLLLPSDDWERTNPRRARLSRRTAGFLLSLLALAGVLAYDYYYVPSQRALAGSWFPTQHEWLLFVALLVFAFYVGWPLATNPARTRRYWRRLRTNPAAIASVAYVALFVAVGLFGPFLVEEEVASLYRRYQPPVLLGVKEATIGNCVSPTVDGVCKGTWQFPLGTDHIGHGVLTRVVYGTRAALVVAAVGSMLVVPIASAVGIAAGYLGGWVDEVLMRFVDVQESVPSMVAYILLSVLFGESLFLLLGVFGLLSWGGIARLVRSETLQRRESGYVRAAREAGGGHLHVARRHLLPNVSGTVLVATTQLVPLLLLTHATLEFLFLLDPFLPSWGQSIAQGLSTKFLTFPKLSGFGPPGFPVPFWDKWWVATMPALALAASVSAFAVLGDALRDVLDPRSEV